MAAVDLNEYRKLQDTVLEVEKLLAGSPQGVNPLLATFLANAKKRIEVLEHEIKEAEEKVRIEQAGAAKAAEAEAALNQDEKSIFASLLKKDFFTKHDLPEVDSFYKRAWDKLTEGGKGELSHRVWEGIRHGEAKFSELLGNIKEKEAKRLYELLNKYEDVSTQAAQIPESDRKDFIRAFESGKKEEAYQILDRQSFTNNVSVSREIKSVDAQVSREVDSKSIVSAAITKTSGIAKKTGLDDSPSIGDFDLDAVKIKGVKLADASTQGVAANTIRAGDSSKQRL